jgi:hypothetical protein
MLTRPVPTGLLQLVHSVDLAALSGHPKLATRGLHITDLGLSGAVGGVPECRLGRPAFPQTRRVATPRGGP